MVETVLASTQKDETVVLLIKTTHTAKDTLALLRPFDEEVQLTYLFSEERSLITSTPHDIYEVATKKGSVLEEELLGDLEDGEIPDHLVGITVIKPDALSLLDTPVLEGEDISDLR